MRIPHGIKREHIFQAMLKISTMGVPPKRSEREWAVKYEGKTYPCKLLISWGSEYAGQEELDSADFTTAQAQQYLTDIGFEVVHLNEDIS